MCVFWPSPSKKRLSKTNVSKTTAAPPSPTYHFCSQKAPGCEPGIELPLRPRDRVHAEVVVAVKLRRDHTPSPTRHLLAGENFSSTYKMQLAAWALAAVSAPVAFSGGFLAPPPPPCALKLRPCVPTATGVLAGAARFRRGRSVVNHGHRSSRAGDDGTHGSEETAGLTRSGLVKAAGAAVAAVAVCPAVLPASAAAGREPEPEITSKAFIEVSVRNISTAVTAVFLNLKTSGCVIVCVKCVPPLL